MNRWVLALVLVGAFLLAGAAVLFFSGVFGTGNENKQLAELANLATSNEKTAVAERVPGNVKPQDSAAGPGWAVNCQSRNQAKEFECGISQNVVFKKSGQLLTTVTLRVPADAKPPVILIRLPLRLYLPAGATYQIDANVPQALNFRACVRTGCYAQTPATPEVVARLKAGKQLIVGFQNLAQKPISVPLSLDGFGEAYDKVQKPI
jgi:invasion protein IalB